MDETISFAEREHRRRAFENQRRIAVSAVLVREAVAAVRDRLPDGWRAVACQHIDGALHTLDVEPAVVGVDAIAYLIPPTDDTGRGWGVRVHNRTERIDFPLYRDGGARAASFDNARDAVDAAISALRVEIAGAESR